MTLDAEQALFDACVDAAAGERERLLAACPDAALRDRVRRLLAAHEAGPSSTHAGLDPLSPLAIPRTIDAYRVLERLGEGAMGEVYLAEQQRPVRRRVALKVLKFGLSTREVIARFELERQTLAMLTHPNIAGILDAGATGDGRPYFAMEYVAGIAITHYCDERRLPIEARLALFAQVCAGVQHAHLRGIIHRDLKPSNILVTEIDGKAHCRIIDFGIAKATTIVSTDTDAHTRIGHLLGTPEYMSPEQAQLSPLDIDARTDVYSLGIVLYELLTGSRPYSVTRDSLAPERLAREIAEHDALRPSARAAQADADGEARAQRRGLTSRALAARLRGDLDWIVLKAIEKDRNRRYTTPLEIATDLQRHAANQAVLAGPPSWSYQAGRFVRRHRLAVAMAASLFLAAILFASGMGWLAREAARERDRANLEAEIAKRVTGFTAGLFEMANPASTGSSDITARELLDAGVRRLERELAQEKPEIRAELLQSAGNAYRGIGAYQQASRLIGEAVTLRRERAADDPMGLSRALLAESALRREQGNYDGAIEIAREAIRPLEAAAAAAPDDAAPAAMLAVARLDLIEVLRRAGQFDEAGAFAEQVLAELARIAPGSPDYISALYQLGRVRSAQGRLEEADSHLRRALEMQVAVADEFSEGTIDARGGLAENLVLLNRPDEALPLLRRNVEAVRRVYGERHALLGIAWNNLANALSDIPEHFAEAEKAYLTALDILSSAQGLAHPEVATTYNNLGALYVKTRQWERAADAHRRGLDLRIALLGDKHPNTSASRLGLALSLNKLGKFDEAETLLRDAHAALVESLGAGHWRTANVRYYLGVILQSQGRLREAEREVRVGHQQLLAALGPDHPRTQAAQKTLEDLRTSP